jgi:outer membrane protein OmpA-like peptidoglycan-associated protein
MKTKHLLIAFCLFITGASYAQTSTGGGLPNKKDFDRMSIGLKVGLTHLNGDLLKGPQNNTRMLDQMNLNLGYGLMFNYQLTHSIGLRASGMLSKFESYDKEYLYNSKGSWQPFNPANPNPPANYGLFTDKYESNMYEAALEMTYNFGNISFLNRNKNFHMVATLGAGVFNFDGDVTLDGSSSVIVGSGATADTVKSGTVLRSSGNTTELMVPLSLGFKYKIGKIDLGLAMEYRKTFTDNADATSKTFSEYDSYYMFNVGVCYSLGKNIKPMEWVNPMEVVYNDIADIKENVNILSGDKDKDGVSDLFDKDNATPEGIKVYGDGTTVDSDGDGVADSKDADPYTAKGAKVDANGQEVDTDGDGVSDSKDLEPATESGSLVNFQGLTIAKPGQHGKDGVSGSNGSNGSGSGYMPSIFFDLGSATVKSVYNDRIFVIAKMMKTNPSVKITITGNCDATGSDNENQRLGARRAENVKDILVKNFGIDSSRISAETNGSKDPITVKLNSMNRRVDFSVK